MKPPARACPSWGELGCYALKPITKQSMSCHDKETLENMLEDVINELDLSESAIEKHGPLEPAPAELVRLVLDQKDMEIRALKSGMKVIYA